MKRIALLSALALITSLSFGQSSNNRNMPETLSQIVDYPSNIQLNQQNNFALVEFSINEVGIVKVSDINASSELKSYVLNKLNGYQLINSKGYCGKTFQYKLTFQK